MTRTVSVLLLFLFGSLFRPAGPDVHAGLGDQVVMNAQASPGVARYRSDHFRDPFVPKSVVPHPVDSSGEVQDVGPVKVIGTMLSAQGRWAMLEFEDGERLIVVPGQVISAYSRIVKRITEEGVTLSATGDQARSQAERTYRLSDERDSWEPRTGGDSRKP